jgi:hypothetical protein
MPLYGKFFPTHVYSSGIACPFVNAGLEIANESVGVPGSSSSLPHATHKPKPTNNREILVRCNMARKVVINDECVHGHFGPGGI